MRLSRRERRNAPVGNDVAVRVPVAHDPGRVDPSCARVDLSRAVVLRARNVGVADIYGYSGRRLLELQERVSMHWTLEGGDGPPVVVENDDNVRSRPQVRPGIYDVHRGRRLVVARHLSAHQRAVDPEAGVAVGPEVERGLGADGQAVPRSERT